MPPYSAESFPSSSPIASCEISKQKSDTWHFTQLVDKKIARPRNRQTQTYGKDEHKSRQTGQALILGRGELLIEFFHRRFTVARCLLCLIHAMEPDTISTWTVPKVRRRRNDSQFMEEDHADVDKGIGSGSGRGVRTIFEREKHLLQFHGLVVQTVLGIFQTGFKSSPVFCRFRLCLDLCSLRNYSFVICQKHKRS